MSVFNFMTIKSIVTVKLAVNCLHPRTNNPNHSQLRMFRPDVTFHVLSTTIEMLHCRRNVNSHCTIDNNQLNHTSPNTNMLFTRDNPSLTARPHCKCHNEMLTQILTGTRFNRSILNLFSALHIIRIMTSAISPILNVRRPWCDASEICHVNQ